MSDQFWESYKHPHWQEKRLRIMERAGFKCESCARLDAKYESGYVNEDATLEVHHAYYERGKEVWEYPDDSLHCLCKKCHDDQYQFSLDVRKAIGFLAGIDENDRKEILGYLNGWRLKTDVKVKLKVEDFHELEGICRAWGFGNGGYHGHRILWEGNKIVSHRYLTGLYESITEEHYRRNRIAEKHLQEEGGEA